jgi:hypothetical protein
MKSEREILNKLRDEAEEACQLFSNAGQPLQERTVVAGLLRVLGVSFDESELVKQGPEPIDVHFRDARFQVTELLDSGRPRNAEVRQIAERRKAAGSLQDLIEPGVISSRPAPPDEVFDFVRDACRKKHSKYGHSCQDVDLLVYVNLKERHLYPIEPWPNNADLGAMGWRSVSFIMEPYARVLLARADAPSFLRVAADQTYHWQHLESCFPVLACRPTSGCS